MAATALGLDDDVRSLTLEIARSSEALNTLAWDEEAGYYSYTVYDEDHQPPRFLRNETGENMNKGMDGIYPLIAGVVSPGSNCQTPIPPEKSSGDVESERYLRRGHERLLLFR